MVSVRQLPARRPRRGAARPRGRDRARDRATCRAQDARGRRPRPPGRPHRAGRRRGRPRSCRGRSRCRPARSACSPCCPTSTSSGRRSGRWSSDIFALYGRSAELTRMHMLYCLFRHAASQVLRDVVVRTGQRIVVEQLSAGALKHVVSKVGITMSQARGGQRGDALGTARGRGRGRRVCVLGHAAGREDRAPAPRRSVARPPKADSRHDVRPLRTAHASGGDRARVRPRASAGDRAALQHRADAGRAGHPPREVRRARARASALGPRAALGEGPVDRRTHDQRARGNARGEARVPHGAARATAASCPPTASTNGRRLPGAASSRITSA